MLLEDEEKMKTAIKEAVREGIRESVTPELAEQFWGAGLDMLQKQATEHAGRFVIGGIMGLTKKLALFLLLGSMIYAIGGWSALANLFKVLFHQGGS